MLVKIVDHKGKERYINAAFVKSITAKGSSEALIEVSGWATKLRVRQSADEVAVTINASMPDASAALAAMEEQQLRQQQAATIAVIG